MRTFELLDTFSLDEKSGLVTISANHPEATTITLKREGLYVVISISYGPFEIGMRPRAQELGRVLARLTPVEGLNTTRQIGTGQAYLAVGLKPDGTLLMRPTIVADASGYMTFNLSIASDARKSLYEWLPAVADSGTGPLPTLPDNP
jgi:hypothetical protein